MQTKPGWGTYGTLSTHYGGSSIWASRRAGEALHCNMKETVFSGQHDADKSLVGFRSPSLNCPQDRHNVWRAYAPRREGEASACPQQRRCQSWLQASCGPPASAPRACSCNTPLCSTHTPASILWIHWGSTQAMLCIADEAPGTGTSEWRIGESQWAVSTCTVTRRSAHRRANAAAAPGEYWPHGLQDDPGMLT